MNQHLEVSLRLAEALLVSHKDPTTVICKPEVYIPAIACFASELIEATKDEEPGQMDPTGEDLEPKEIGRRSGGFAQWGPQGPSIGGYQGPDPLNEQGS